MLESHEIIQFLKKNKSYLRKHFHCSEIGLFGSNARNEQIDDSDIDILIDRRSSVELRVADRKSAHARHIYSK